MTDHTKPAKRATPRSPSSGKFETPTPINDPDLLHQSVAWVRSIDTVLGLIATMAKQDVEADDEDTKMRGQLGMLTGSYLKLLRDSMLDQLSAAEDKQYLRDARKSVLKAPRLRVVKDVDGGAS